MNKNKHAVKLTTQNNKKRKNKLLIGSFVLSTLAVGSTCCYLTSCNNKKQFKQYSLSNDISGEIDTSYTPRICEITTDINKQANFPSNFTVKYEINYQQNELYDYLVLSEDTPDNETATLKLLPGLKANGQLNIVYKYQIITTVECAGWESKQETFDYSITIRPGSFSQFTINVAQPANIHYGYTKKQWTAIIDHCTPAPEDTEWSLVDVSDGIKQNLTISPKGVISLSPGANIGDYSYKVRATVSKPSYAPLTITTDPISLKILKLKFDDFTIQCGLPKTLSIGYFITNGALSINMLPDGSTVTYQIPSYSPGLTSKIALSGSDIILQPGVGRGQYYYDIKAIVQNPNYEEDVKKTRFFITIDPGDNPFPTPPTLQNPWATHNIKEFYKQETSTPITILGKPDDYNGLWGLQLINANAFNGDLVLNENNSNYSLTLKQGLTEGNYSYTIRLVFGGDAKYEECSYEFPYTISIATMPMSIVISDNHMTADTQNGYTAFCNNYNSDHQAFNAFDGKQYDEIVRSHYWEANWKQNDPTYGVADIGQALPLKARLTWYQVDIKIPYKYKNDPQANFLIPHTWIIQGTNDGGVSWTNVGQEVTHSFFDDHKDYYDIVRAGFLINQALGDGAYSSYRMHITVSSWDTKETTPRFMGLDVSEIIFGGFVED